jgi:hypothetical protein
MLDARTTTATHTRAGTRVHAAPISWGIVDGILAAIMLPFGAWMWAIDRVVAGIAALLDR